MKLFHIHNNFFNKTSGAYVLFLVFISYTACNAQQSPSSISDLKVPEGFKIEVFAENVENARQMALSPKGILFVGTRSKGKVYAVVDSDHDYKADKIYTIAEKMNMPNGVAFKGGALYVAEVNKIWRFDDIENNLEHPKPPVLITDNYPTDGHHGWKYIAFGPDGKLYVPVGAPCNICNNERKNPIYATITRINPDGSGREIVAKGIRNSVGFTWHPETGNLWFTDNGRDMLGDDIPPCELNELTEKGQHFGYPYMHGSDIWDPEFGKEGMARASEFKKPVQNLGPHVAPLGLIFYTGNQFPEEYKNQILIAEHGSWNRSKKIGYRITMVTFKDGKATSYKPLVTGWLHNDERVTGRPVALLQLPDGSVLISDDYSGKIYRLSYIK